MPLEEYVDDLSEVLDLEIKALLCDLAARYRIESAEIFPRQSLFFGQNWVVYAERDSLSEEDELSESRVHTIGAISGLPLDIPHLIRDIPYFTYLMHKKMNLPVDKKIAIVPVGDKRLKEAEQVKEEYGEIIRRTEFFEELLSGKSTIVFYHKLPDLEVALADGEGGTIRSDPIEDKSTY